MRIAHIAAGLCLSLAVGAGAGAVVTWRDRPAPPVGAALELPGRSGASAAAPVVPRGAHLRVMLDPGHGGSNTGASGVVEGVYEKRVTLAIAELVADKLRAAGAEVVLTREDDRYLTLRERVRLANESGVDVFVSLHANASPGRAQRGFETWVLTPEALAVDARAIRAGDGRPRPGVPAPVADVLDDAERDAAQPWSLRLAEAMQTRLAAVWGQALGRGVRQGTQDVLMGLTMPGVLVEVGFIDHPVEGAALLDHEVRARLADAVAGAVLDWAAERAKDPR